MLNASAVGGSGMTKALLDAGVYPGRLVGVIDLGMQVQRPYKDEVKPPQYEIMTTYEFADEFMQDEDGNDLLDKPRWLSETFPFFNLGAVKAKSTARYLALDPEVKKGGEWVMLLGNPVNITVIVNEGRGANVGKKYNNIAGISTMRPKDVLNLPELVNLPRVFDLDDPDMDVFKGLPDWIRDKIKSNLEYKGSKLKALLDNENKNTGGVNPGDGDELEAHFDRDEEELPF